VRFAGREQGIRQIQVRNRLMLLDRQGAADELDRSVVITSARGQQPAEVQGADMIPMGLQKLGAECLGMRKAPLLKGGDRVLKLFCRLRHAETLRMPHDNGVTALCVICV
jgi:hypothetical protein